MVDWPHRPLKVTFTPESKQLGTDGSAKAGAFPYLRGRLYHGHLVVEYVLKLRELVLKTVHHFQTRKLSRLRVPKARKRLSSNREATGALY